MTNQNNKPKMTDGLYNAVKAVSDSKPENFFKAVIADEDIEQALLNLMLKVLCIEKWDTLMLRYTAKTATSQALIQIRKRIMDEYEQPTRNGKIVDWPLLEFKKASQAKVTVKKKQKPQEITAENAGDTQMGAAMLKAAEVLPNVEEIKAASKKPAGKKAAAKKATAKKPAEAKAKAPAKKAAPKKAPAKTKTEEKVAEPA